MRIVRDVVLSIPFAVVAALVLLAAVIGIVTAARFGPVVAPVAHGAASAAGLAYFWVALRRHRRARK